MTNIPEVVHQVLNNVVGHQGEQNFRRQLLEVLKSFHWLETVLKKSDTLLIVS